MLISHKIALKPNNQQATYLAKACGTARFAYNWGLAEWKKQYKAHLQDETLPKPSQFALRKQLNALKAQEFPWMLQVTKNAPQMALIQLGQAFENFFKGRAQYPRFRKKGIHERFSLTNDQFRLGVSPHGVPQIRIPCLGWVRLQEALRFSGKVMSATVSQVAHRWFISLTVETPDFPLPPENQGTVGVDLGVSTLATLSNGEVFAGPKALKHLLPRLKRLSRRLSKKQPGSANRWKAKKQLARLHFRIRNLRQEALHQLTHHLTKRFECMGIEDLNVKGMMKNRHLARAIADMGFCEFRRQLEYKAKLRGRTVVVASRWFPSSKLCSACGHQQESLPLQVRRWQCPTCATTHERDLNAAQNLKNYAVSSTV